MDGDDETHGDARKVTLTVNGSTRSVQSPASLLSALRSELGLTGAKPGCGEGACGSCTVLVDGEPEHACRRQVADLAGRNIMTIEAVANAGQLHHVQQAFVEVGAAQCGYCTPGMVMISKALIDHNPDPSGDDIRQALTGNVCRCTGYQPIVRAISNAAQAMRGAEGEQAR